MAPKKKKRTQSKPKLSSEETLPTRRSSLQVNLSYVSSLSDSGNRSSRKIEPDNNQILEQEKRQSQFHSDAVQGLPNIAEASSSIVCIENAVLSDINKKEEALNQSCLLLKAAILNKTREMFDQRAELAVKTTSVLKGQQMNFKETDEESSKLTENKQISVLSSTKSSFSDSKSSVSENRPETRNSSKSTLNQNSSSTSRVLPKNKSDKSSIITGSNKTLKKIASPKVQNKVLTVRLTRLATARMRSSSESSQCSSVADDIGLPLTCSSFISVREKKAASASLSLQSDQSDDGQQISKNSDNSESKIAPAEISSCSLTPMEITAVQGFEINPSSNKRSSPRFRATSTLRSRNATNLHCKSALEVIPMELTTVQNHIPNLRDSASNNNDNKTSGTSLNVNTSADDLSSSRKTRKRNFEGASILSKKNDNNDDRAAQISLRVNTSLGTDESPPQQEIENDKEDSKKNDQSILTKNISAKSLIDRSRKREFNESDNISLIARLRNLSSRKSAESANCSKVDETTNNRSSIGDGPSFVEGTPFPPSRSLLWKTQIKMQNAIRNRTARGNSNVAVNEQTSKNSSSSTSAEYLTLPHESNVVDDTTSGNSCVASNSRIIDDSSEGDKSKQEKSCITNVAIPKENKTPNIQRPGKKKLMSLQQDLQLVSLSPLSPAVLSPKKPILWKPRRRLHKRKAVRAIAAKRIEATRVEDEEDEASSSLKNEIHKEKEKTRTKKPRKVISKKIVVKKIAGLDILAQLEGEQIGRVGNSELNSTNGERSSLNEFTKKRKLLPTQIMKNEKLVIVATGFAKGDVDLVKSVVKDLGGAEINSIVTRRTTHVVSTGVRTINLLRGIIRGCWLVSLDWVLKSLENEKWLNAEKFEMNHFSKAVQENRRDRQIFGKDYVPDLFTTCGPIYIEHGTTPPPSILKELVKTAGGRIADDPRNAKLSVGAGGLKEIWILDSITTGDLQPIKDYERKS